MNALKRKPQWKICIKDLIQQHCGSLAQKVAIEKWGR